MILERSSYCLRSFDINRDWKTTVWLEYVREKWAQPNFYSDFDSHSVLICYKTEP